MSRHVEDGPTRTPRRTVQSRPTSSLRRSSLRQEPSGLEHRDGRTLRAGSSASIPISLAFVDSLLCFFPRGCRRRKIKCDGCKPSCVSCQLIYKEPVGPLLTSTYEVHRLTVSIVANFCSASTIGSRQQRTRSSSKDKSRNFGRSSKLSSTPAPTIALAYSPTTLRPTQPPRQPAPIRRRQV